MNRLYKIRLITLLFTILISPNQLNIGTAFCKSRTSMATKLRLQGKRNTLNQLFDAQIDELKQLKTPKHILDALSEQKDFVLTTAMGMDFEDGSIPFLPVIPFSVIKPRDITQISRSGDYGNDTEYKTINPDAIYDTLNSPTKPYYIYGVLGCEDHEYITTPKDTERVLYALKRLPLTAAEVLSAFVHIQMCRPYYILALGSRYRDDDSSPMLHLRFSNSPNSEKGFTDMPLWSRFNPWKAASCLRR